MDLPSLAKPGEAAREWLPDDLDQTPDFDPAYPQPISDDNDDKTGGG